MEIFFEQIRDLILQESHYYQRLLSCNSFVHAMITHRSTELPYIEAGSALSSLLISNERKTGDFQTAVAYLDTNLISVHAISESSGEGLEVIHSSLIAPAGFQIYSQPNIRECLAVERDNNSDTAKNIPHCSDGVAVYHLWDFVKRFQSRDFPQIYYYIWPLI